MRKQLHSQQGFTLIEIAIVLVIIGLLLGGVLKGQELINTARVRALNNSVDGVTAAWFSFQDRYRAFPGDYIDSRSTVNLPGAPGGGDGNGLVGNDDGADAPLERGRVWVHLEAAGYITGGYNDDTQEIAATEYNCSTLICPDNGFGSGMVVGHGQLVRDPAVTTGAHELNTGGGIPVDVLAELDRKVDDGQATTGLMQISEDEDFDTCVAVDDYQLQTPVDNCAAIIRNF
ncbi:MAG: prepilin-type N-terminal cleavage/methylation domain-containing protein [Gammaproteobacteria bacterium]|nr:prepilin-type N-terminal cleavage/methylation domain-containing protein [Gammaproteobacteria bacterium]